MQPDRYQRGFISISGVVSLLLLASMIFIGVKIGPPYVSFYQLQDSIHNLALIASYSPMSEEEIRRSVMAQASNYGIDLDPKQLTVHKGSGQVVIVAHYTIPVDFLVRRMDLQFEPSASNRTIGAK